MGNVHNWSRCINNNSNIFYATSNKYNRTELYTNNVLSLGQSIAGLLTNSGVALLVLFKSNKNIKENIKIISIIYVISTISGLIIDIFIK